MAELVRLRCVACRRDAPTVTDTELAELKPQIPEWELVERDGIRRLRRVFPFRDFAEALAFTNRVGALAEEEGHHPDIYLAWGKVRITIWTHKIDGLTESDFVFAAMTKSLMCRPLILWVHQVTVTRPHSVRSAG